MISSTITEMGVATSENASPIEISENIKQIVDTIGITSITLSIYVVSNYKKNSDGSIFTNASTTNSIIISKDESGNWVADKSSIDTSYKLSYTAGKYNASMTIKSITVS